LFAENWSDQVRLSVGAAELIFLRVFEQATFSPVVELTFPTAVGASLGKLRQHWKNPYSCGCLRPVNQTRGIMAGSRRSKEDTVNKSGDARGDALGPEIS